MPSLVVTWASRRKPQADGFRGSARVAPVEMPLPGAAVHRVHIAAADPAGAHPHQHLPSSGLRRGDLTEAKRFILFQDQGFHCGTTQYASNPKPRVKRTRIIASVFLLRPARALVGASLHIPKGASQDLGSFCAIVSARAGGYYPSMPRKLRG